MISEETTEGLIREILRRTEGENVVHVIDCRRRDAKSYGFECADRTRKAIDAEWMVKKGGGGAQDAGRQSGH